MSSASKTWDTVVIGGGPAGMMAAGRAGERGQKVLLLEKNPTLGKKLLITGGGRCNVTNNKPDVRTMLARYKTAGMFLFSAFAQFSVSDTFSFFASRGMPMKEENDGRMFPMSDSAQSVWDVMVAFMKKGKVTIQTNAEVTGITRGEVVPAFVVIPAEAGIQANSGKFPKQQTSPQPSPGKGEGAVHLDPRLREDDTITITLADGSQVFTKSVVLATGGTSHPETGSTGEGFKWVQKLGHTIVKPDVSLVPIALTDGWVKDCSGVALSDIKLTTFKNGIKQKVHKGRLLFTHFGISGPTVLNMSREVGDLLENDEGSDYAQSTLSQTKVTKNEVKIVLDLFPTLDLGALREKLQTLLISQSNKKIKNVLSALVPSALVQPILTLAKIDPETPNHSVRTEDRKALITLLKNIPLHVKGLLGKDKAIISSGGVVLTEVDFKTMQSRIIPGLYFVGDVLNIDRPSGGYGLQLCWTTGFVAGEHC